MKYKISVVIPTHNIEKYLKGTLNSILNQTIGFENLEVIIVDDNSTDGTKKIIEEFVSKYENFKGVYLTENSGFPGKPRNIGLRMASSNYIIFMDHDDFYAEDAFEVLYHKITEEDADMVFCRYAHVFNNGKKKTFPSIFKDITEIKINNISENTKLLTIVPSIWTKIFKVKFIEDNNIKFPEGMLAEDLYFVMKALLNANGIIYLNNYYGYNYRIRNSDKEKSTIHIKNKKYLNALISGYYETYSILKKEKKEIYYPIIFERHLKYWINSFVTGDLTKAEKKELLKYAAFLIEKLDIYGFEMGDRYSTLLKNIKNKKFDDAVLISEEIKVFKIQEYQLNKIRKKNKKLHKQLNNKNKRVAELQTVKGWSSYKIKNIFNRLKQRIKR